MKRKFKNKHSFEKRQEESRKILTKYPERVPVIVERGNKEIPDIDRNKFLVPSDLTVAQFVYVIRKRINIHAEKSLYIFVNDTVMPATSNLVTHLYDDYKSKDGFLYITYCGETTFG